MSRTSLIDAEIDAPNVIELKADQKAVRIAVRLGLRNDSEHDVILHAPSKDHEIFWHVFDSSFRELFREPGAGKGGAKPRVVGGVHSFRGATIASGHGFHVTKTLKIAANKLKGGETYTIRAEVFSHIAETEFVVVQRPARLVPVGKSKKKPATAAKKRKTPARKSAKKAVAPKRAVARKPAKRKPTKKKAAKKR